MFLMGMRFNKPWKVRKSGAVFTAMGKLLGELAHKPESGFLGAELYFRGPHRPMLVQCWRSFEHLEAYARNRDESHWPVWVGFNKRIASNGDVGIWHETYLIPDGRWEGVYNNMPPTGLGAATALVPATGRKATESDSRRPGGDQGRVLPGRGAHEGDGGMSSLQRTNAHAPRPGSASLVLGERSVGDRLEQLRTILPAMAQDLAVSRREAARLRRENAELVRRLSAEGPS